MGDAGTIICSLTPPRGRGSRTSSFWVPRLRRTCLDVPTPQLWLRWHSRYSPWDSLGRTTSPWTDRVCSSTLKSTPKGLPRKWLAALSPLWMSYTFPTASEEPTTLSNTHPTQDTICLKCYPRAEDTGQLKQAKKHLLSQSNTKFCLDNLLECNIRDWWKRTNALCVLLSVFLKCHFF